MQKALVFGPTVALVCLGWIATAQAESLKTDFALLNEPGGDQNVICRCAGPRGLPPGCQIKVTMGARHDAGRCGVNGVGRGTHADREFVHYHMPAGTPSPRT